MTKIPVGVLGATGMVGQQYIALLANHPWFEVRHIAASAASAGKTFLDATRGRLLHRDAPLGLTVADAGDVGAAKAAGIAFVFSAIELEKSALRALEEQYAAAGIPVISNSSAHRWTGDVPMLIAEINPQHCGIITAQRARRGWDKGFIAVKPNCSIQSYMTPLWALMRAGYEIQRMIVSTMQAVSGAGYPGVPSLDMIDNLVPFINGEEEKTEQEPLKIFGRIENGEIVNAGLPQISASCNRVPVSDGHTACVSLEFGEKKPGIKEIRNIWESFSALPQHLKLPSAPQRPIIFFDEPDRPQPKRDRDCDKAMAVSVGRLRPCNVLDIRFVGLSHNTVRGAAGGGILNAELLYKQGFLSF